MKSKTEAEKAAEGLDHPCKQTCSGWKQGYEKGFHTGEKSERIMKLIEALRYIAISNQDMMGAKTLHFDFRATAAKALAEFEGKE